MLRSLLLNGTFFSPLRVAENEEGTPEIAPLKPLGVSSVEDVTPPAAETEGAADPEIIEGAEPAEGLATPEEKADWRDKEIRRKHAQNLALKRENEELRAIAQRVPKTGAEAAPGEQRPSVDPDLVKAEAAKIVAQNDYTAGCNNADASGKKTYGDAAWNKAIENLTTIGGMDIDTMAGVLATDNPARVLYELGQNPGEYQRIMELTPARRLAEMVKIAIKPEPKKKISSAPPPVEQVQGSGGPRGGNVDLYDDKVADDAWYAKRTAEKRANWLKKNGRAA